MNRNADTLILSPQHDNSAFSPEDRITFFAEQQRNRRATWRMMVACGIALFIVGIPLCLVLSPLLYAGALIVLNTIHLVMPIPSVIDRLQEMGTMAFAVFGYLAGDAEFQISSAQLFSGVVLWLAPGIVTIVVIWLGVYSLFRHAGVGSVLLCLGARPPQVTDIEEKQLCNLAEEMALAAGVPAPRVMLLDANEVNAAAIGTSVVDATLIFSRRALDVCNRDETQGMVGQLIGSISNGDLRIAFLMTSVRLTFAMLVTLLRAPFGPHGRTMFLQLVRLGMKSWKRERYTASDTEFLKTLIADGLRMEGPDDLDNLANHWTFLLLSPLVLASLSVRWTLFVLLPGLIDPILALLWRTRRHLADATAVQLTRNPDGVASAIRRSGSVIPGSQGVAELFLYGPAGAESVSELLRWQSVGFHPSGVSRLQRLRAQGAEVEIANTASRDFIPGRPLLGYALQALLAILLAVAALACLAALVLFVLISIFFTAIALGLIQGSFALLALLKG